MPTVQSAVPAPAQASTPASSPQTTSTPAQGAGNQARLDRLRGATAATPNDPTGGGGVSYPGGPVGGPEIGRAHV